MAEELRFPLDQELIILRSQKVLKAEKFDYSLHAESKKLIPRKAIEHNPDWRRLPEAPEPDLANMVKPHPAPKRKRDSKPKVPAPEPAAPVFQARQLPEDWPDNQLQIVPTDKESIMSG
mgnify:CR=1 FL=1